MLNILSDMGVSASYDMIFLIILAALVGVFAVVIGGAMFFAVPVLQLYFPEASFGALVGNMKVGSFFRSITSTISTFKHIDFLANFKLSAIGFIGTIIGASLISNLDQTWLFPAIIAAVLLAVYAPKLTKYVTPRIFHVACFLTGLYAGLFGAGIGIILIALVRLKYPEDEQIAHVKIQARFIEWLFVISAVVTHIMHGNIIAAIWVPWSIGMLIGGYFGGMMLVTLGKMSGTIQKGFLYAAFVVAIVSTGWKAFGL